jgi:hypothetical protein
MRGGEFGLQVRHAERTHMQHPPHTGGRAGPGQLLRQLHMGVGESLFIAVQLGHQVDDRILSLEQRRKPAVFEDVGLHQVEPRLHLHRLGPVETARGHGDLPRHRDQLGAHMAADESGTAKNQQFFHEPIVHPQVAHFV